MRCLDKEHQRCWCDSAQRVLVFRLRTKGDDIFESKCFIKK